jgi:uncharacterized protein (TIGR00645 family)
MAMRQAIDVPVPAAHFMHTRRMNHRFERYLLASRWLLLPLYLALLGTILAIYVTVGREVIHLFAVLPEAKDTELVLLVLSVLDLVLVANLVVMVALSSYESSISPIEAEGDKPDWLGKLDSSTIKVKVALSVVMISAIHLLRAYMTDVEPRQLVVLGGVHLVFIASALGLKQVAKH